MEAEIDRLKLGTARRSRNDDLVLNLVTSDGKERQLAVSASTAASFVARIAAALASPLPEPVPAAITENEPPLVKLPIGNASLAPSKLQIARKRFSEFWLADGDDTGERLRKWSLCALEENLSDSDFVAGLWLAIARDK